jgi:LysR family nitrogen assimilation transcriptional regulator
MHENYGLGGECTAMETRRLVNFVAIVDCGSLTRAAERMHIAQPALSQQVAALEAEFGKPLLLRTHRGVTVTSAGRALYTNAQSLLRQMKQLESDVKSAGDFVSGSVSVGIPVSCAAIFSMPLLTAIRRKYPQIVLRISENLSGLLGELILNNRLDIAMLYASPGSQGLVRKPMLIERMCLVCRPSMGLTVPAGAAVHVASLADVPLVLPGHSNGLRALVDAAFARHGLKPKIIAELDSLPTLRGAAEQGLAATILPRSAAHDVSRKLEIREIIEPTIERTIVLCRPTASAPSQPVEAVEALLIETLEDLVVSGRWKGVTRV